MPALPWTWRDQPDADTSYVVMFSRLPLRRARSIPGFLRDSMRVRRQLASASGLVGYALKADLGDRTFWTVSAWVDESSLRAFAGMEPHRRIMERLAPLMGQTRFHVTQRPGSALPVPWDVVTRAVGTP